MTTTGLQYTNVVGRVTGRTSSL